MQNIGRTLADILWGADPEQTDSRQRQEVLVTDSVSLIEQYVAKRGGIKGIGLKTGLAMARAAKPDLLPKAMQRLLPEFAKALEPLFQAWQSTGRPGFDRYLGEHASDAAAAMLSVADQLVTKVQNPVLKSVYTRLRGGAEAELQAFMPGFAGLLQKKIAQA